LGLILVVALVWFGLRAIRQNPATSETPVPSLVAELPASMVIDNDPVKIFQKAFWRSPGSNDTVLHAERREWQDEDGNGKWQWFLVVRPSPDLIKYLRDDNAFGLVPAGSVPTSASAPPWFAIKTTATVLQAPAANLRLMFSESDGLLYATDSGQALSRGAPELPPQPSEPSKSTGPLPSTPPPDPRQSED
jgi:hypothetical protein